MLCNGRWPAHGKNSFSTAGLKNLDEFYQQLLPVIDEGFACGAVNVGLSCPGFIHSDRLCMGGVENLPYLRCGYSRIPPAAQSVSQGIHYE
ncbi:MAG: hypothetical protein ACLUOI_22200 [Eisenbergiella sp.]